MNTFLPVLELFTAEMALDPINRLADVLERLQNKLQLMTTRSVRTTPMTFDSKSEKFELFENLFHTMIKIQPVMAEQTKTNHFRSLLRKVVVQKFLKYKLV